MRKVEPFRIEWDAHEYEHKERSQDWFWAVGIIAVSLAVVAVILHDPITGILVLVAAFALSIFINRHPDVTHVVVDEKGITRGRVMYPYSTLESFWIDIEHPHHKILLKSEKFLMPIIVVPLNPEVDAEKLHENMSLHLHEEYHAVPFVEKLLEHAGF